MCKSVSTMKSLIPSNPKRKRISQHGLAIVVNSGRGGKANCNQQGGNQGKNNRFQPYDGLHYDGRHPSASYVQKMKEKWGADYWECKFCEWPGHTAYECNSLRDAKAQRSSRQHQSAGQKSSGNSNSNSNRENKNTSSNFITWDASVTELVANTTTVMKSEHIWGLDSHANVHITPYRHRFVTYRAISTLQKAGIMPKSVQIDPHWCKSCVEGKQTKLPYR